jgi:D-arabinose 1-dehydrogenase-like Zn-dependent alcohol dehydrogenase
MYHVKSWPAHSPTRRPGLFEFDRRSPRPEDIVSEILYCGVCHSDLHKDVKYRFVIDMASLKDEVAA